MAPPSEKFEITNYDVLADEISNPISTDESDVGLSLAAHSYHVGNNRLEVMCNIHNQAYTDFQAKGDEFKSAEIVEKIMDIVQNQCEPKGRFLERNSKGEWKEVETAKARKLVRQALSQVQSGHIPAESKNETLDLKKKQEADAEKKRRRRSSLLRRSVSSSMLPNLNLAASEFDDKKKSTRFGLSPGPSPNNSRPSSRSNSPVPPKGRPVFGRSRSVELVAGGDAGRKLRPLNLDKALPLVKETKTMDVLLNTTKTALLPGTDLHGNNRLRVMVTLQTGTYQAAMEEEQTKMAEELVKTIENFWGGRVLSKVPTRSKRGDGEYVKLDNDNATKALKNLLSGKQAAEEEDELEVTMGDAPETTTIKRGRRASLQAIQSIGATAGGGGTVLPSTLPTLPADMQHLRSAAVKSLQKRKQRQGLNSRIRGYTADKAAVFQDGSSNASVISSTTGNTSPTPSKIISNLPNNIPTTLNTGLTMSPTRQYRQGSSGASVASTVTELSSHPNYPQGSMQRKESLGGLSNASVNSNMTPNTMNAARTMAQMNLGGGGPPMMQQQYSGMMQGGMGGPVLGSELQIPANGMMQQPMQMMPQQMVYQQQQPQFQQRVNVMMPSVPEELHNSQYGRPPPLTAGQLAQLNQGLSGGPYDHPPEPRDRNSLLNSTGSDGLPNFKPGEMDLLIKGLEEAEKQQQSG